MFHQHDGDTKTADGLEGGSGRRLLERRRYDEQGRCEAALLFLPRHTLPEHGAHLADADVRRAPDGAEPEPGVDSQSTGKGNTEARPQLALQAWLHVRRHGNVSGWQSWKRRLCTVHRAVGAKPPQLSYCASPTDTTRLLDLDSVVLNVAAASNTLSLRHATSGRPLLQLRCADKMQLVDWRVRLEHALLPNRDSASGADSSPGSRAIQPLEVEATYVYDLHESKAESSRAVQSVYRCEEEDWTLVVNNSILAENTARRKRDGARPHCRRRSSAHTPTVRVRERRCFRLYASCVTEHA